MSPELVQALELGSALRRTLKAKGSCFDHAILQLDGQCKNIKLDPETSTKGKFYTQLPVVLFDVTLTHLPLCSSCHLTHLLRDPSKRWQSHDAAFLPRARLIGTW